MNAKLIELARRRERLLARAEEERAELAGMVRHWHVPVMLIDRVVAASLILKAHPVLLVFPIAVLTAWQPRKITVWIGRAWMLWRFWRHSPLVNWLKHAE